MPPKLVSDDGKQLVIRPLAYCSEKDISRYSEIVDFPIIPCNLCGSQENLQRKMIKNMLNEWDVKYPGRIESMFRAMQNVTPSHLVDKNLFDFANLKTQEAPYPDGDIGFDAPEFPEVKPSDSQTVSIINL